MMTKKDYIKIADDISYAAAFVDPKARRFEVVSGKTKLSCANTKKAIAAMEGKFRKAKTLDFYNPGSEIKTNGMDTDIRTSRVIFEDWVKCGDYRNALQLAKDRNLPLFFCQRTHMPIASCYIIMSPELVPRNIRFAVGKADQSWIVFHIASGRRIAGDTDDFPNTKRGALDHFAKRQKDDWEFLEKAINDLKTGFQEKARIHFYETYGLKQDYAN